MSAEARHAADGALGLVTPCARSGVHNESRFSVRRTRSRLPESCLNNEIVLPILRVRTMSEAALSLSPPSCQLNESGARCRQRDPCRKWPGSARSSVAPLALFSLAISQRR